MLFRRSLFVLLALVVASELVQCSRPIHVNSNSQRSVSSLEDVHSEGDGHGHAQDPHAHRPEQLSTIDLHSHSILSDGKLSLVELVEAASEAGLKVLAITDHDHMSYDEAAIKRANELGITLVHGAEISTEWTMRYKDEHNHSEVGAHLLAYFTASHDDKSSLRKMLEELQGQRVWRNQKVLDTLKKQNGIDIDYVELQTFAHHSAEAPGTLGRRHMAEYLVHLGKATSIMDAFEKFLSDDKLKLPSWALDFAEATRATIKDGAVPVLAHPLSMGLSLEGLDMELGFLKTSKVPLVGMECYHPSNTPEETKALVKLATTHHLIPTGGSGFHDGKVDFFGGTGATTSLWIEESAQSWDRLSKYYETMHVVESAIGGIIMHLISYGSVAAPIVILAHIYADSSGENGVKGKLNSLMHGVDFCNFMCADVGEQPMIELPTRDPDAEPASKAPPPAPTNALLGKGGVGLLFCFFGLQASYLTWGLFQERIMTLKYDGENFTNSEFLVLVNRVSAMCVAYAVINYKEKTTAAAPPYKYSLSSVSNVMSSWFQYEALKFVSFPLQVLSKSSKIMFSMWMGKMLNGKSYPWKDYAMASTITAGLAVYRFSETHGAAAEDETAEDNTKFLVGGVMLFGYIMCDSFTSQWQSKVFKQHKISAFQMMLGVNACSSVLTTAMLLFHGQLLSSAMFLVRHPACMWHSMIMSVCSATGQLFIFHTISTHGPVPFASIMTARQFGSILLSIFIYGHTVNLVGCGGLALVFVGLVAKLMR